MGNRTKNCKRDCFFLFIFIFLFNIQIKAQNIDSIDFPDEVVENVKSLTALNKSKSYDALIGIAENYKEKHPEYKFMYDTYIMHAYFELREFDKVIEYAEPYMRRGETFLFEGALETTLGQAYIQKGRIEEGCALLKKVKNDEPQFIIAYGSNCYDYKEYKFSVPGNRLDIPTDLTVQTGDVVNFQATGKVIFGMFAGSAGPEGFKNGAFRNYNRTQEKNHGELFFTISSDPYLFYGLKYLHLIKSSGRIIFHINDKDIRNNSGSFSATIRVYENPK
ncbi:hypothetical protein AB832_02035 [Flavobacteriaceae bacterium (ex Bugula neritina AB1)]|nr:hypothetical protein AB832_02035 [Flavobacteriaceae bacterium (ex Bugula neritina AB1)]